MSPVCEISHFQVFSDQNNKFFITETQSIIFVAILVNHIFDWNIDEDFV